MPAWNPKGENEKALEKNAACVEAWQEYVHEKNSACKQNGKKTKAIFPCFLEVYHKATGRKLTQYDYTDVLGIGSFFAVRSITSVNL